MCGHNGNSMGHKLHHCIMLLPCNPTLHRALNGLHLQVKTVQQRCYAEAAVAKQLDWDSLEDTLGTDEARREVATLRSTYMDVERRFKEMSKVSAVYALRRLSAGACCRTCICFSAQHWQCGWQGCQKPGGSVEGLCLRCATTRRC